MRPAELILYATPTGPLADALARLDGHLADTGRTTAQDYPPHCTLTGFFHRDAGDIGRIVDEVAAAVADVGPEPTDAVRIVALHRRADWIGLELASPWLKDVTVRFVELHRCRANDDALRPKDWLHLSIAYGVDDLREAAESADGLDLTLPVDWEVRLWQRHDDGGWTRHE